MRSALGGKEVQLDVNLPCEEVFADQMFGQVLYNLVDNSVKHGGDVKRIKLTWKEDASYGHIIYEDDGKGIPPDEKEWIFERGYGNNTGLGLFLSREILSFTDIVLIESGIPGAGARFEIRIPPSAYRSNNGQPASRCK
jgi:signal transduction histidine kinase